MTDKPRLGPWLRQYERRRAPHEDRPKELALAAAAAIIGLVALIGLVWLFMQAPLPVMGGLVAIWAIGYLGLVIKRRRAQLRDKLIQEGHAFEEIRKAMRK